MPDLVDTHCHVAFDAFDDDREEALERARRAGVRGCLAVAVDAATASDAAALADAHPGFLAPTAGIHPNEPRVADPDEWARVRELVATGRFVAVGETGLDFYRDDVPAAAQTASLRRHLDLALEHDLPAVIHCRDAFDAMAAVLADYTGSALRGVLHCFTGTVRDLEPVLAAGLHVGVGGVVTYKRNDALREAVRETPRDRLLFETDAPWLAPQAVRGRRNEPAFVAHVAAFCAEFLHVPLADLARVTTDNARALFGPALVSDD